jgi:hypothetical protein
MNPLKKIKNYLQKSKEKNNNFLQDEKIELTKRLDQLTNEMLSAKCAINGFKNCSNECIHFNEGSVFLLENVYHVSDKYLMIRPICKLWRK